MPQWEVGGWGGLVGMSTQAPSWVNKNGHPHNGELKTGHTWLPLQEWKSYCWKEK